MRMIPVRGNPVQAVPLCPFSVIVLSLSCNRNDRFSWRGKTIKITGINKKAQNIISRSPDHFCPHLSLLPEFIVHIYCALIVHL